MRSVFKFLSLPKSSFTVTSIGVDARFELPRVITIFGAIGKLAVGFDDAGVGAATIAELGMSVAREKTISS